MELGVLHRDRHVIGDRAEEPDVLRAERAVHFVEELQHTDDFAVAREFLRDDDLWRLKAARAGRHSAQR